MDYLKIWPEIERWLSRYTDEERGRVFMAMMAYTFRGEEPDWPQDAREWCVWEPIRDKMDGCAEKVQTMRANGQRGGRRSAQNDVEVCENTAESESKPKQTQAEESKEKQAEANVSNGKQTQANESPQAHTQAQEQAHAHEQAQKENGKRARARESAARFAPPTLGECETFFAQHGGTVVQATQFHAYYTSNGWRVGKNPMKDWQASARGWIARQSAFDALNRIPARASPGSGDVLLRQSREERAAAASAAVVDLDCVGEVGVP